MKRKSIFVYISLFLFCSLISMNPNFGQFADFSEVAQGQNFNLSGIWSNFIKVEKTHHAVSASSGMVQTLESETLDVTYKLFGIFPLKSGEVKVMKPMKLLPGGQSIGVSLQTKGVLVVGQAPIVDKNGKKVFPAKEAGIEVGDTILKINNKEVQSDQDVSNAINLAGEKNENASIVLKHQGRILEKILRPVFCLETGRYRLGLYVRDEAAGVGTLSYVDPVSKEYGALGHVITDADTNQKLEVSNGKIIASSIYAIEKGKRGHPGEKLGSFVSNSPFSGTIDKNTITGIFGKISGQLNNPYFIEPIPVGWESEVKTGPAKIYTVVQGDKIEEFSINIDRVMHNRLDSKNMIVRITDPRLLQITGGIIQGMSGSPIVQDGKIIGAVTHVFVNDSQRGYGVFIQNMLNEGSHLEKEAA